MAHSFSDNFDGWYKYAERNRTKPPRPLLTRAMGFVERRDAAIDIGSGGLNDTRYLLDSGFAQVTALDGEPVAQADADTLPPERFTYTIAKFEDYAFPPAAFDLVNAQYALPFIRPERFSQVFAAILASLRAGGVLTGQFFGDRDDWAGTPNMTFHAQADAKILLEPLTMVEWTEEDDVTGTTLSGQPKHWHLFHFIARHP